MRGDFASKVAKERALSCSEPSYFCSQVPKLAISGLTLRRLLRNPLVKSAARELRLKSTYIGMIKLAGDLEYCREGLRKGAFFLSFCHVTRTRL